MLVHISFRFFIFNPSLFWLFVWDLNIFSFSVSLLLPIKAPSMIGSSHFLISTTWVRFIAKIIYFWVPVFFWTPRVPSINFLRRIDLNVDAARKLVETPVILALLSIFYPSIIQDFELIILVFKTLDFYGRVVCSYSMEF
jgi:hypothetical protein